MPLEYDNGDSADALGQNQYEAALAGTYWIDGWDASLGGGDLEVDIASGEGAIDGSNVSTGSTQTVDFDDDPDSGDPRKAVISVDSDGEVQKTLGDPAPAAPENEVRFRTWDPAPPASGVPGVVVAEVWLEAGVTELVSDDVRDRRVANLAGTRSVQPITKVDEAVEFDEDGLTISNDSTIVEGGSIGIQNGDTLAGDSSFSFSEADAWFGVELDVKSTSIDSIDVTWAIGADEGEDAKLVVHDGSSRIFDEDVTDINDGDSYTIDLDNPLDEGETYYVVAQPSIDGNQFRYEDSVDLPVEGNEVDYTGAVYNESSEDTTGSNRFSAFERLTFVSVTEGSAVISWSPPEKLEKWDLVTYQSTEDGETVTVNILDSEENELLGDISQNTNIDSIDPSENIQLEVELSRDNTDNNPTLDYAARRFER